MDGLKHSISPLDKIGVDLFSYSNGIGLLDNYKSQFATNFLGSLDVEIGLEKWNHGYPQLRFDGNLFYPVIGGSVAGFNKSCLVVGEIQYQTSNAVFIWG